MMYGPYVFKVTIIIILFSPYNFFFPVPAPVPFEPIPIPRARYTTSTPIPAPRKVVQPAQPTAVKPRDIEDLRTGYISKLNELFDILSERFQQLDL